MAKKATTEEAPAAPRQIRVWQDTHNALATVLAEYEDGTLDLSCDLFGTGRVLTLFGVHQRQGTGNGWEVVEE